MWEGAWGWPPCEQRLTPAKRKVLTVTGVTPASNSLTQLYGFALLQTEKIHHTNIMGPTLLYIKY